MKACRDRIRQAYWKLLIDTRGQDMIEYALMASAVAVACGALLPPVREGVGTIFSKVTSIFGRSPG